MDTEAFKGLCARIERGETICVEHSNGQQGKVLGCLRLAEALDVEVKQTAALELWHRTNVTQEVPC